MNPYYEHAGITIYHGDCLRVLEALAPHFGDKPFDLLLTDPPYGIGEARGKNASRDNVAVAVDYGVSDWDDKPASQAPAMARSSARHQLSLIHI